MGTAKCPTSQRLSAPIERHVPSERLLRRGWKKCSLSLTRLDVAKVNASRMVSLSDVMRLERAPVKVHPTAEYPNLGIYSFGKGVFPKPPISGAATSAPTLYRVRARQLIYSRLFAFEGAYALVPPDMDGWYVSNEYPTFDVDESKALPEFVRLTLCRRRTWEELAGMTVGMGHRRQRLQPDALLAFEIHLPSLE